MKIRPEYTDAVAREDQTRSRTRPASEAFEDVLAKQVGREETAVQGMTATLPGSRIASLDPLLPVAEVRETANQTSSESEVMEHIDSLLSKWENYAQHLEGSSSQGTLRDAYGMLSSISGEVAGLKQAVSDIPGGGAPLRSMIDELEVMTVTEQFKFNRGDYTE